MNKECTLIEKIYKDAAMGRYSTQKLMENLKGNDNEITDDVEEIFEGYSSFEEKAKEVLISCNMTPEEEWSIAKMMSSMGIMKEVLTDNSDPAIADLLIQGISMGVIEMEKRIKGASDDINKDHIKLAKEFLKFQEKAQKKMEKYL